MSPANLDGLRSKDGKAVIGPPYFTSLFILMYNEPMLKQAGFNEPAKSWDELISDLRQEQPAHRGSGAGGRAGHGALAEGV